MAPPQQAAINSLSSQLETLTYINSMLETFRAFDSNNDGLITSAELGGIMSSLGYKMNGQEVREMMSQRDADKDGLLSAEQFLGGLMEILDLELNHVGDLAGMLEAALSVLDADEEEGTVSGEELYEVVSGVGRLTVKDCLDIVASMDGDGDGAVDIDDLRLIVQALN